MTGLEWPRPGTGTWNRIFSPVSTFQVAGGEPVPVPSAPLPRKEGQLSEAARGRAVAATRAANVAVPTASFLEEAAIVGYEPLPTAIRWRLARK